MVSLLFSFRGRINRKQYWFGTTLVGFLSLLGQMLSSAMSAGSLVDLKDPAEKLASAASSSALLLPLCVVVLWCSFAVQFKRFHDRGRTGWISMAPMVLVVLLIVSILGDIFSNAPLERMFSDALPYFALLMLTSLAFFIDLGCLPSVEGTNKYGPPPWLARCGRTRAPKRRRGRHLVALRRAIGHGSRHRRRPQTASRAATSRAHGANAGVRPARRAATRSRWLWPSHHALEFPFAPTRARKRHASPLPTLSHHTAEFRARRFRAHAE
jgi:uncharacterized membrane protein YhaH (DUF805 family)